MTDTPTPLTLAARRRADDTRARAIDAIRHLHAGGEPISYAAVAAAANVSRSWLYRQPDLRVEVDRLRAASRQRAAAATIRERASAESNRRRVEALRDHVQRLTEENRVLREQVARRYGEARVNATT